VFLFSGGVKTRNLSNKPQEAVGYKDFTISKVCSLAQSKVDCLDNSSMIIDIRVQLIIKPFNI